MKWKKDHNIAKLNGPGTLEQLELSEQAGLGGPGASDYEKKTRNDLGSDSDEEYLKKPRLNSDYSTMDSIPSSTDPIGEQRAANSLIGAFPHPGGHLGLTNSTSTGQRSSGARSCSNQNVEDSDAEDEHPLVGLPNINSNKISWPKEKLDKSGFPLPVSLPYIDSAESRGGAANDIMFLPDCESWHA